jgi:hypothetical protein
MAGELRQFPVRFRVLPSWVPNRRTWSGRAFPELVDRLVEVPDQDEGQAGLAQLLEDR